MSSTHILPYMVLHVNCVIDDSLKCSACPFPIITDFAFFIAYVLNFLFPFSNFFNRLHNQFPVYSLGTRLCKKWVCSHLLSAQIPEEVVELLVAHLFLHPEPYLVPG